MHTNVNRPHILICGRKQTGKSTLIRRLLSFSARPVYGFFTKMDPAGPDGYHEIYIYPAWLREEQRVRTEQNLIGRCDSAHHEVNVSVFETLGTSLIKEASPGGLIVMDELGFMEADAPQFKQAVLEALQSDIPVLAAVKERYDVPFLNAVRSAEKARSYALNEKNRDELYDVLCAGFPFIKE